MKYETQKFVSNFVLLSGIPHRGTKGCVTRSPVYNPFS